MFIPSRVVNWSGQSDKPDGTCRFGLEKYANEPVRSGLGLPFLLNTFHKTHFLQVVNYILFAVNHRCSRVVKSKEGPSDARKETVAASKSAAAPAPAAKKTPCFDQWENIFGETEIDEDELDSYVRQRPTMTDDHDLLGCWETNSSVYLELAQLARQVLCVPAAARADGTCSVSCSCALISHFPVIKTT